MVLEMPLSARGQLERWAEEGYPRERCGLLLGQAGDGVVRVAEVTHAHNLDAGRARDRYALDPDDYLRADARARAQRLEIVGVWHTHPDHPARPSASDRAQAWGGWSYLILSVSAQGVQAMRSWRLEGKDFIEESFRS